MTTWEPVATPGSHLEPGEPASWMCVVCEAEWRFCTCLNCDECGEQGPTRQVLVEDCTSDLCPKCERKWRLEAGHDPLCPPGASGHESGPCDRCALIRAGREDERRILAVYLPRWVSASE